MQTQTLHLAGMVDGQCALRAEQALKALEGVQAAEVSFAQGKAMVLFNQDVVSTQHLKTALKEVGLHASKPPHGEEGSCCGGCGG